MKIFISSVRRGLEEERDSLPGLIMAIGHEALRFEDFTSQPTPSREACLRGVQAADVYLLLLGPHYGDPLAETGLSPTHEEYNAARTKGIPRLAFRKTGVDFEPAQADFAAEVETYSTGLFRENFSGALELQAKVVAALRALPSTARVAVWSPLPHPVTVEWREGWSHSRSSGYSMASVIDVHAIPIDGDHLSSRQLRNASEALANRLRSLGVVPASAAIEVVSDTNAAWAYPASPSDRGGWDEVNPGVIMGITISASGQRSVWQQLPSDRMGSLLDPDDLPPRMGSLLRLLGSIAPPGDGEWAIAIGLTPSTLLSIGPLSSLGHRNSAQTTTGSPGPLHIEPDEAVSAAALDDAANEVGHVLAQNLIDAFARRWG